MTQSKTRLPVWVALILAGLGGGIAAIQARLNGGMTQILDNGFVTSGVSVFSGLLILGVALLFSRQARQGFGRLRSELSSGRLPHWSLIGGLFGAGLVLAQSIVTPVLGLALLTVGIVAGQVLGSLLVDRMGLGPGGKVAPSLPRVIGTVLVIVAVIVSVFSDLLSLEGHSAQLWVIAAPFLAGIGMSLQSATNGLVRAAAQSAVMATLVNFSGAAIVVAVGILISVMVGGWPSVWPSDFWYYLSGPMGVLFIGVFSILVRTAGVLLLNMAMVVGQLIVSLLVDWGMPIAGGLSSWMVLGSAIALVAVVIAAKPLKAAARDREG